MKLKVDNEGRILIPFRIRNDFNLQPGSAVEVTQTQTDIIITPDSKTCYFCQSNSNLNTIEVSNKKLCICQECQTKL
jgi:AbrB family looped-hinge helix DNA binding protein